MKTLAIIIFIMGFSLIIFRKRISNTLHKIQYPAFKVMLGKKVDSPFFRKCYTFSVVGAGIVLILGAAALFWGPLEI